MKKMKDIKELNLWQTILDLPNRIVTMIWKMISIKVGVLVVAIWLIQSDKIEGWHAVVLFLFTALIVIFGREAIKWLEILKGLK
ncbi:hypothetical protein KAR91_62905 [Candidatus Pacearchaeota archaeon]|nr:hypothetical protein [Candidatus Pacearchaeota archaeon]